MAKSKAWELANPDRNWKTNLSQEQIDEIENESEKKSTNPLIDWLTESEQIK